MGKRRMSLDYEIKCTAMKSMLSAGDVAGASGEQGRGLTG